MPKTVYMGGNPIQFADDVTDGEIVEFGDMQRQQSNNMRGIISPVANMIAQASMAAPVEANTLPQINGGNYAFAGKQVVQNALQQSQRSNQDRVSAQIQQRGMLQQQMEAEKDRSQQFKLEQTRMQNELKQADAEFKMRTELEKAIADGNVEKQKIIEASRAKNEQAKMDNQIKVQELRNEGSAARTQMQVEGANSRAAMNAARGGGGGSDVSWQRTTDAAGNVIMIQPKTGETKSLIGPDGNPVVQRVPAGSEPKPEKPFWERLPKAMETATRADAARFMVQNLGASPDEAARYVLSIPTFKDQYFGGDDDPASLAAQIAPAAPATPAGKTPVARRQLTDGRVMVQYSDGTIGYK